jgi:peptide/nickel transport system substrate-binding protein
MRTNRTARVAQATTRLRRALIGLALVVALGTPSHAGAAELRLGIAVEPSSLDPHFQWFGASIAMARQVFEPLVTIGEDGAPRPLLATSWESVGDAAWRFHLRPGVVFSDGAPLTPDDVAFTFARAPNVPNSPTGFGPALRQVASVEAEDPHTILIRTTGPAPMLPKLLSAICIVSRHAGEGATTADYNSTKAAIGTGPYRVIAWERGGGATLVRNDRYWGARPEWDSVRIRYMGNPSSRVAALLAGDVDVVDQVAGPDVELLQANPALRVATSTSLAVVALLPDVTERVPPFITANDGAPLQRNPLADLRVRQALALAINRAAIKERVMHDQAVVATQIMLPGQFGYDETRPAPAYDPVKARALLAEAG